MPPPQEDEHLPYDDHSEKYGQACPLQNSSSSPGPWQPISPAWPLTQTLECDRTPPPHGTLHSAQLVQVVQNGQSASPQVSCSDTGPIHPVSPLTPFTQFLERALEPPPQVVLQSVHEPQSVKNAQVPSTHSARSSAEPKQPSCPKIPPIHLRLFVRVPNPHVTVHAVQLLHSSKNGQTCPLHSSDSSSAPRQPTIPITPLAHRLVLRVIPPPQDTAHSDQADHDSHKGQSSKLQTSSSVSSPKQPSMPGSPFTHIRAFILDPPPHVTEHGPY